MPNKKQNLVFDTIINPVMLMVALSNFVTIFFLSGGELPIFKKCAYILR